MTEDFTAMYERHYVAVLRYALRRTDPETARDVAAETFGVAWRRRHHEPNPSLPWLYAVARRVLANELRSGRRRGALHQLLDQEASVTPYGGRDPAEVVSEVDEFQRLVRELAPTDREVLRLVAWEELSLAETAEVLGCSVNAAAVRLHRARKRLAALRRPPDDAELEPVGPVLPVVKETAR